jgi:hypothetical protein
VKHEMGKYGPVTVICNPVERRQSPLRPVTGDDAYSSRLWIFNPQELSPQ